MLVVSFVLVVICWFSLPFSFFVTYNETSELSFDSDESDSEELEEHEEEDEEEEELEDDGSESGFGLGTVLRRGRTSSSSSWQGVVYVSK